MSEVTEQRPMNNAIVPAFPLSDKRIYVVEDFSAE